MGEKLKKPSRPLSTWLKWVLRLFGTLFTLAGLWSMGISILAFWLMAHSNVSKSSQFGLLLASARIEKPDIHCGRGHLLQDAHVGGHFGNLD